MKTAHRLLTFLLPVAALAGTLCEARSEASVRPGDVDEVLAVVPVSRPISPLGKLTSPTRETAEAIIREIRDSLNAYRLSADPVELMSARGALRRLESQYPGNPHAAYFKAVFFQQEHRFEEAIAVLDNVLQTNPEMFEARVMKAGVYLVQGETEAARKSCAGLLQYGDEVLTYACAAAATATESDIGKKSLELIALLDRNSDRKNDSIWMWANSIAADLADRSGNSELALRRIDEALSSTPRSSIDLLIQKADLLLEMKKYSEADTLLKPFPEVDAALLRRVIALKILSDKDFAEVQKTLRERMDTFENSNARQHARELALYYLDVVGNNSRALAFARESFSYQKETIDFRTLLRAALTGRDETAKSEVLNEAKKRNYFDSVFLELQR